MIFTLFLQLFFKKRILDEQGYVLFVRKNALQILIPKYGLEGTIYLSDNKNKSMFTYNEEVSQSLLVIFMYVVSKNELLRQASKAHNGCRCKHQIKFLFLRGDPRANT